jgi:hypothetical protein
MDTRIEEKLDKIVDKIGRIDVTLAAQYVSLEEHIKRTKMLEDRVKPIEDHVVMLGAMTRIIGAAVTIIGVIAAIVEIIKK